MRKFFTAVLCLSALIFTTQGAPETAPELKREILGLHLDMGKAAVQKRLKEIGKFVRDERKRQEVWEVRDERFSHLAVGFDAKETLRYVTAMARTDKEAKRVGYGEIGDVKAARQAGDLAIKNFAYEWSLPAAGGEPAMLVIVRGRDPEFLSTYSLKRVSEAEAKEEKEED